MTSITAIQDLIVVGGGVNGAGIAMDAAGRDLKVMLCEMSDLASATSSNSSKLIHGGLRYLEHYEFRLVREALAEREALLRNAPHIMWPLRFRLPHRPHLRPAWMIRAGLFLYDHLAKRELLPGSHGIGFATDSPLASHITRGFEYSDGWVDDARLVVLLAKAAEEKGAEIRTRCRCVKARRENELWAVTLRDENTGRQETRYSRALVNASGPWVSKLFEETMASRPPKQIRMVKGSHIVVPRIHDEPEAYILQNEDSRIVFVIPYEDNFSLIGTTDVDYAGDPSAAEISLEEADYLISVVNDHFKHQISHSDIVYTYSGVRPLMDEEGGAAQKATRDYTFEVDAGPGRAPLLSVFGGKITTYRKLAQAATDAICKYFPEAGPAWTKSATLPGGNFETQQSLQAALARQFPWLPLALARRFTRTYGTLSHQILDGCRSLEDLGPSFGASLHQREVDYLVEHEWAQSVDDIIWRRTRLGLYLQAGEREKLANYLDRVFGRQQKTMMLSK
ncbi:glycerol-3-phosphate dehydrogenase [Marinobacterium zhoushanense]|uniref:Glycerol-3-phosphate dehydrogenase n=1 Tax=Marinobacterium zhoushanense TaxID=1679163 RepID=A0ABQ1K3K3_9GAMM|nr:glycerol-3-phosphate dehydrogenase [Marinobacterium zhoushanense]GGB86816.1 glycerol-3-phosphate dehydrogenase [Marinobacterium zhoushanense]